MTRNDIHCPKNIVPADYVFVGLNARRWEYGAYPLAVLAERDRVAAHMARTGGTWSDHQHGGNCMVCGAHCIYTAAFYHAKTNSYIYTGMDCAEKLGLQDANRFRVFRDAVEAARHHRAGKKKAEGLLLQAGLTRAWELYRDHVDLPETEAGFVLAIQQRPDDTFARLVYGDWLEEQGRADQAARVRGGFPVERLGVPRPAGERGEIIHAVAQCVRYGNLPDWSAKKIRDAFARLDGVAPTAAGLQGWLERNGLQAAWDVYRAHHAADQSSLPYAERTICDIIGKSTTWARLTDRQAEFVRKLLAEIAARRPQTETERLDAAAAPAQPARITDDMTPVLKMFEYAHTHGKLVRPKVRLQLADGSPVVLALAGKNSKYAGQIMVTDGGKYGESKWYGVISTAGSWKPGRSEAGAAVLELLKEFAADPVTVAVRYGRLTGHCCFCGKHLTDERSTEVGYGPVCAGHWNLPWGGDQVEKDPLAKGLKLAAKLGDAAAADALHDYRLEHPEPAENADAGRMVDDPRSQAENDDERRHPADEEPLIEDDETEPAMVPEPRRFAACPGC